MTSTRATERENAKTHTGLIVAAIQMVSLDDLAKNFQVAQKLIVTAADKGATLLVLPENFLAMGERSQRLLSAKVWTYLEKIQELAQLHAVNIVAGSVPVPVSEGSKKQFRSASFLVDTNGKLVSRYDKIHLFDVNVGDAQGTYRESDTYESGSESKVGEIDSCKVGLSICYDLRFPLLFQKLVSLGAELIVLPAAFTKVTGRAHWEVLVRARAIETQCFIVAANQGGQHSDKLETWGHSMIVDPWGQILAECGPGESICTANLDFGELSKIRNAMPIQQHKQLV